MEEYWGKLGELLNAEGFEKEAAEFRDMFNSTWDGEDDLGDILFGKYEDFK